MGLIRASERGISWRPSGEGAGDVIVSAKVSTCARVNVLAEGEGREEPGEIPGPVVGAGTGRGRVCDPSAPEGNRRSRPSEGPTPTLTARGHSQGLSCGHRPDHRAVGVHPGARDRLPGSASRGLGGIGRAPRGSYGAPLSLVHAMTRAKRMETEFKSE